MSTYTDLHNTAKETLNVDYHTRVTPQKVHFVHPENTYHGAFVGEIHTEGNNSIVGGIVASVTLSNSILDNVQFKNGLVIDDIVQDIVELSAGLQSEAETRSTNDNIIFTSLCGEINATNINLEGETIERKNADDNLSVDLTKVINNEVDQSKLRDAALNSKIDVEITNRISADEELEKRVNDKMLHDRHLDMHLIDNREFPLVIHDYAINTYVDSNANAYVYKNGDTEQNPIGRIEKAAYEDDKLVSFEFNAFANHPDTYELTAAGVFQYYFDKNNVVKYTGVGGYRLSWDIAKSTTLNNMQLVLDSANNNGYYDVNFSGTENKAGTLDANYKLDASGAISSCMLTITSQLLSNFILAAPFNFVRNGETKTFTGRNGKQCEITLCSNNSFEMYEQRYAKYYLPVINAENEAEFARIYDGNVILSYDGTLKEVGVDTENGRHFNLNVENGFKLTFDVMHPYKKIIYDQSSNIILIKEEKKYYRYDFNGEAGNLIPGKYDVPNKRIDDSYETVGITLNISSAKLSAYVNGEYRLNLVDAANKYQIEKEITQDNFGKIKITFIKDICRVFVDIMPNATTDFIHLSFDISNISAPTEIDMSSVIVTSKKICDDIKHARQDEKVLDDKYTSKYVIEPNLVEKKYSGESKKLISQAKTEKKDTLTILMPNKQELIPNDYTTASSKFILNFKVYTESLQDDDFVSLIIKSNDTVDKFYYMNREVSKIFIKKNKWSTLEFVEIRPHRYIINDLDYSEIDARLKWLRNELSCHEISSTAHIMKLSDDVEFLLSVDRETMNYKGTLPLMAPTSPLDGVVRLSAFIAQSPYIYGGILKLGDMFKLSAPQYGISAIYDKNDISTFLGENDYFIVNSPLLSVQDVEWKNLDIFRNSESEYAFLSIELTNQINSTSSYIVNEVNRISSELSTELCACELSVNGLSIEVDRISSEISATLKLSVDELQKLIVSNDNDIANLSDKVEFILSVDKETVNYKGILPAYTPVEPDHKHNWQLGEYIAGAITHGIGKLDIKLGDLFKVGIPPAQALYDKDRIESSKITFGKDDFFIANKNVINVYDIKVADIDIFRNAETEVTRLSIELSTELCACELSVNGLSIEVDRISSEISTTIDRLSTELSTELYACELSVNGLSLEVDRISSEISTTIYRLSTELSTELCICELSVNGLSARTNELCAEISNMLSLSVDSLQKQIISNDSDISSISTDLSVLEHHYYDKTMSCDIVLEHVKGPKVTDHISAYVDKLLIVDEVTFDLYALTIRNGALNINKVKTIEENYHVDCCKK